MKQNYFINTGDTLRGFPWREVLGDSKTMNGLAPLQMLYNETIDDGMSEMVNKGELSDSKSKLHSIVRRKKSKNGKQIRRIK